ncbi:MAG: rhodanese-like domain-containing protein [Myxococcaceae bacterium]|nr:MAG: rhodanese-like domain-containing protein [Myxococcaceae bacterium]
MNTSSRRLALALALSLGLGCAHSTATGAGAAASTEAELRPVTVAELAGLIERGGVTVIDNNSRDTFERGHIPGARWIAYDAITAAALPTDRAARVVFYCHNEQCTACHTAARQAMALGYSNVFILPAGIVGWTSAGRAVETGPGPT